MTRIKICGLCAQEDIAYANALRPDYIGFVFAKESRRYVTADEAKALRAKLAPGIISVGVFTDERAERIAQLLDEGIIDVAQLHAQQTDGDVLALRQLTRKPIIQAFCIHSHADVERAKRSLADYILLDNGSGGTGEAFDWSLLGSIGRPFFLAGGLHCTNVLDAVMTARPYAVDVSSGVETNGRKDQAKMRGFIQTVRDNTGEGTI